MAYFERRAARRISMVSVLLALITAPVAWLVAAESAEREIVLLAMEESKRFLPATDHNALMGEAAASRARAAAEGLSGGLFDIAEIYDAQGRKLAESMTATGTHIEDQLPGHGKPGYTEASYESVKLHDGSWALRVFVPMKATGQQRITGYFEGVRVVPAWQRDNIESAAIRVAGMTALAALLCGLAIFPIVLKLSRENAKKAYEILDSHIAMMEALGRAIAKRDSDTGAHNYRVAWIAARIGEALGLSGAAMQALIAGSFLHDVGKIGIPDAILLKQGKLDEGEMSIMRTHVALGEEIVHGMGWLDGAHEVVAGHHEKWDGSGYPRGLAGDAIPLSARIFAVADVFDALSSKRPYKLPFPFEEVMTILQKETGSHFDPAVMQVFLRIAPEVNATLKEISEADAQALLADKIKQHFLG